MRKVTKAARKGNLGKTDASSFKKLCVFFKNCSSLDYFTLIGEINARFGISLDFEADKFGYTLGDFEKIIRELVD